MLYEIADCHDILDRIHERNLVWNLVDPQGTLNSVDTLCTLVVNPTGIFFQSNVPYIMGYKKKTNRTIFHVLQMYTVHRPQIFLFVIFL